VRHQSDANSVTLALGDSHTMTTADEYAAHVKSAADWLHWELVPVYFRTAGSGDVEAILKAR